MTQTATDYLNPSSQAWQIFKKNRMAVVGLVLFLLFAIIALFGVWATSSTSPLCDPTTVRLTEKLRPPLTPANTEILTESELPPFGIYLMGTDDLGRDIFSRMLQGAWVSLTVGFVAVGIAVLIGICFGGIAGYFGHKQISLGYFLSAICGIMTFLIFFTPIWGMSVFLAVVLCILLWQQHKPSFRALRFLQKPFLSIDVIMMRFVDIMMCFPSFFLILTVVALLPASIYNIMIVIGLTSWMGTTRFVRAEFLSLREQDFVLAARALGVTHAKIIFRYMMPNAIAPVLVSTTIGIATAILTEAGLSFLGFGVPPPHATWGNILADGKRFIFDAPWITFIPGIAILLVVLSFNLFGEGLRDATNPRLRRKSDSK